MKPLRILLIIHTYPPVWGGSEIEAQRVSAGLIRRGHSVQVLCGGGGPMPRFRNWLDPEGVPVKILTRYTKGRWKDFSFAAQVAWHILRKRRDFDLVYFLMQGLHLAAGMPVARLLRQPMILKIAGSGVIPLMRGSRAGRWELAALQKWKVPVLLLNDGMIQEALADGFSGDQLTWMPNPVDIDVFKPGHVGESDEWRKAHDIPLDAFAVVYVGRLSREKGLTPLLQGFAEAMDRAPEMILLLVGDGAMRQELESLARDIDPGGCRIRFIGRASVSDVPVWLRAADTFALTSPSEGFPCALLEAMSVGLPSVVTSIPANTQLVDDGIHGFTVPWNDPDALSGALLKLRSDPELRKRMGKAARQRVLDNYSVDKVLDLYENVFGAARSRD